MKRLRLFNVLLSALLALSMIVPATGSYAATSTVKISNYTTPKTVTVGSSFTLKGKITSNRKIKRVEIGIVNSSNKWTGQKYDNASLNTLTFNIAKADPYIKFGKLKAGKYKYRIYAHTSDGKVHIVLNDAFTVKKKASSSTPSTATKTGKSRNKTVDDVKLIKYNSPNTLNVGKRFNVRGTISSAKKINRVEIGIVMAATNKWTEYKYDKRFVNSKTFDISKAASKLKFNELPGGTYKYRIYIHTKSGCKLILNKRFIVNPSSKPKAAVRWAKKIANDNSFTYGAKPAANAVGCYFCGTNCGPVKYCKPRGYEKTYVCLTFVGAAYAHGAKDPEILSECKRGRMTMYETDDNFRVFSCWMKIGKCKDLTIDDLQVGDVIIMWSDYNDNNGHVCMYIGNNNIVESSGGGWGANSIAIKYGVASSRLRSLSSNSRNYVMRYRH